MKYLEIGGELHAPRIAAGCMRIADLSTEQALSWIHNALDAGVNYFDHADIYGHGGGAEERFGLSLQREPGLRCKLILQTKCGICRTYYDFSKEHIIRSAEESLKRLGTDYLDVMLLHRPDTLVEPEEVAEAFEALHTSGKVRYFGVSNHTPMQIELLKKYVRQPLIINQLQMSLVHTGMIDAGINMNTCFDEACDRDGSVLDYCRLHDITIQPWSPFQHGFIEGVFLLDQRFEKLNKEVAQMAEKYKVSSSAMVIAWLLRHPAEVQPVIGTTNPARFADICTATQIELTRQDWYALYRAAGNRLP